MKRRSYFTIETIDLDMYYDIEKKLTPEKGYVKIISNVNGHDIYRGPNEELFSVKVKKDLTVEPIRDIDGKLII